MDYKTELTKALIEFRKKYKDLSSIDIQLFVLGFEAAWEINNPDNTLNVGDYYKAIEDSKEKTE